MISILFTLQTQFLFTFEAWVVNFGTYKVCSYYIIKTNKHTQAGTELAP